MLRSLYSGVAGLKTHQTKMDVIGNNIANVNTVAFKSSSVTFSEIMYQTTQKASGANALTGTGGTNAKQIGLGVTTGAINTNISTEGATQTTGNPFDLKITGDSFFVVNNGVSNYFTRAGAFYVDGAGNLAMTSTGYNVMGWRVDGTTGEIIKDTVQPLPIMSTENLTADPEATTAATISGLIDSNDPNLTSTSGVVMNLAIVDNLGYTYTLRMSVTPGANDGEYNVAYTGLLDSNGDEVSGNALDTISYTLQFDTSNGAFTSATDGTVTGNVMTLNLSTLLGAQFGDIDIDFSRVKNQNNEKTSTIGATAGDADKVGAGRMLGDMIGISITNNGMIYGTYDNGNTKLLGQIAVASFANASGLSKEGENLYAATLNSGEFDGIGQDITANGGSMSTGVLEMSNVDLSAEFTEMITTQRGFQANSRIITTSDTLLEELINLKR